MTECKCNSKELFCKMQNAGLRSAIEELEEMVYRKNAIESYSMLIQIKHSLISYNCLPSICLISRVDACMVQIVGNTELSHADEATINMLIAELKALLE